MTKSVVSAAADLDHPLQPVLRRTRAVLELLGDRRADAVPTNVGSLRTFLWHLAYDGLPRSALVEVLALSPDIADHHVEIFSGVEAGPTALMVRAAGRKLPKLVTDRVWAFADLVVEATERLGGRDAALAWLTDIDPILNDQPAEVLRSPAGFALVRAALNARSPSD